MNLTARSITISASTDTLMALFYGRGGSTSGETHARYREMAAGPARSGRPIGSAGIVGGYSTCAS